MPRGRGRRDRRSNTGVAQAVQTPTGQPYGQAQQLEGAQQQAPLPQSPRPTPRPGSLGFTNPSGLEGEELTAGMPTGPGPGPESLETQQAPRSIVEFLASLPEASPEIRALAREIDALRTDDIVLDIDLEGQL